MLAFEGVYFQGRHVGYVTSGSYSYTLGHDLAFALLPPDIGVPGTELEIPVLGEMRKARVIAEPPYDPASVRSRM